jgi:hypothetical protein
MWVELTRAAVGVLLIAAAAAKVGSRSSVEPFLAALDVPAAARRAVVRLLPAAELVSGVLLIVGWAPWATYPAAVLAIGFAATLGWARVLGVTQSCNCFGTLDQQAQSTGVALARAVGLALGALGVALASDGGRVTAAEFTAGALAAGVYLAFFAILGGIVQLSQGRRAALAARRPQPD